jgi:hypothetical protein
MASTVTVEDGSGVSDADSYVSESDADTYFDDRNESEWANLNQSQKSAALRKATSFLDSHFDWKGGVANQGQSLDWPREDVENDESQEVDSDVIPEAVRDACMELAFHAAVEGDLEPMTDPGENKRIVAGSVEIEYADNQTPGQSFSKVQKLLGGLTLGGHNSARLIRT